MTTTKIERLQACLAGRPADRAPVALWRHFPVDDQQPASLAAATLDYQKQYDFDLVKVTPASSFCLRDWGIQDVWRGATEGTRVYTNRVVQQPEDWLKLRPLNPNAGALAAQLECLGLVCRELSQSSNPTPVLQTIFSPMAQAKNLAGKDLLQIHLRQYPDAVHAGLQTIAETTRSFIQAANRLGIAGIFYAQQFASYALLSFNEFQDFCLRYDLEVLSEAAPLWLNMLHLHGEAVMFEHAASYPVQVINWHDRDTHPSLTQARTYFAGTLCGGLQREHMVLGDPASVRAQALDAIQSAGSSRFILGTGCVMETITPRANILAARQAVER